MSQQNDPQGHENAHAENHEGPIKTPKQLVMAVAASFIIPILAIVLLVVVIKLLLPAPCRAPRPGPPAARGGALMTRLNHPNLCAVSHLGRTRAVGPIW
ncbi:MAG: hypothetical protein HC793_00060 [Aquincola sp.]|nr:hypothetical protein [Aquincola sp.]